MSKNVLQVDPIKCDAHAICAELFPERIRLDSWGFPIIDGRPLSGRMLQLAQKAVADCPVGALRLIGPNQNE
jgi:ferredoxin